MAKQRYYVVWEGRVPGVYDTWNDCEEQVVNFPGAKYKSFASAAEAAKAFREGSDDGSPADIGTFLIAAADHRANNAQCTMHNAQSSMHNAQCTMHNQLRDSVKTIKTPTTDNPDIDQDAWAVDASCLGNPGVMEYRGVEVGTGKVLFNVGPFQDATNNIGEFLAIVHALAEMYKRNEWHNIYSDSKTAQSWIRNRQVKTQLKPTDKNKKVFELLGRALAWVRTHSWPVKIMKWQTDLWGEIPADFGRK